ncbi:MAG: gliding motility-associated C-terminal domain-containing protein [Bacteroidota bacterium]|jgi:gliding motility-associated-like protein
MRITITAFAFFYYTSLALAQYINDGWVYSGNGYQSGVQTHVDRVDNRYQVIEYTSDFQVDSMGYPILIQRSTSTLPDIAIIKFDKLGNYLYHLRLQNFKVAFNGIDIKFTATNDVILCRYFRQSDSINLVDAKGNFFRTIRPPKYNTPAAQFNTAVLLCKFTSDGQFVWANTIALENLKPNQSYKLLGSITVNNADDIAVFFPNYSADSILVADTLSIINNSNQKSSYLINTKYVLLKFNSLGTLLAVKEPFKNLFLYQQPDSSSDVKVIKTITDGVNSYCVFRFRITKPDTLQHGFAIPLDTGNHYLLFKLNQHDSIEWVKRIAREKFSNYLQNNQFDYDTIRKELFFASSYDQSLYDFYFNPAFINYSTGAYICRLDTNGNIIWEDLIAGYNPFATISAVNYNYYTKLLEIIGFPDLNDIKIRNFLSPMNPNQNNAVVAYFDLELNKIISAQAIRVSNYVNILGVFNIHFIYSIGSPITDQQGRTYITGYFFDSIVLPCRKLNATIEFDNLSFPIGDAFVLVSEPIHQKDTVVCKHIQSPSMRYTWDSTGIYYDTLQNVAGCDSVIRFNLTIGKSKRTIDSAVCYSMQSPSARYVWDSSATYTDTIPNHRGCDSIITVRLTVKHTRNSITQSHCGARASPSGRFVMDTSGVYKDTLANHLGCDSLLTIHFTQLRQTDTTLRDTLVCSFFITQQGDTIRANDVISDTLPTVTGCDSIVRYRILIGDTTAIIDTSICNTYLSPGGKLFTMSGTYADTVFSTNGCSVYYTIHISKPPLKTTVDTGVCNTFLAPSGKLFTAPGVYADTVPSARGCDSIITFRIAKQIGFRIIDTAICINYTSPSGRLLLASSGIYFDTIVNPAGCDSVFEIRLTLDTFSVRITKSNDLTCETPTITLSSDAGNRFVWSPIDFLSAANLQTVVATPQAAMQYKLTAYNTTGCEATDSVAIDDKRIEIKLSIPNVFTPNGDNLNDDFGIDPADDVAEMQLELFNRWGGKVFESNNPQNRWRGYADNGNESSTGVYYFIAKGKDRCGKPFEVRGTVSLIR